MPETNAVSITKVPARRQIIRRYIDLAFAKEDLIMASTKTGTGVGSAVADWFTFGLTTPIVKGLETPAISAVRGTRRAQATQMFKDIDKLSPARLQVLSATAINQGEPGFDWLKNQLTVEAASASAGANAASASVGAIAQDIFNDYAQDAIFDQAAGFIPFGIGAGIGAAKSSAQILQVNQRIAALREAIRLLKVQAA